MALGTAILLASAAVGCGRLGFDVGSAGLDGTDGGSGSDASSPDAPCLGTGAWSTPRELTELNSTADEWGGELTPDGLSIYFDSDRTGVDEIYAASRPDRSSPFGTPFPFTALGGASDAAVTPDNDEMYFTASATQFAGLCLVHTTRSGSDIDGAWDTPVEQTQHCTAMTSASCATISTDGLTLIYSYPNHLVTSTRADRAADFTAGTMLANFVTNDNCPFLSADGLSLYLEDDNVNQIDVATRATLADEFSPPTAIPGIGDGSTSSQDVSVSADQTQLLFASNRASSGASFSLFLSTRGCM